FISLTYDGFEPLRTLSCLEKQNAPGQAIKKDYMITPDITSHVYRYLNRINFSAFRKGGGGGNIVPC
ncbi:hypothetical protein ACJX0J_026721, partial [Zea mays]